MKNVFIGLGSNLGDKEQNLEDALYRIKADNRISILKISSLYITEPWGNTNQDDFLNQVIKIQTDLPARVLLYKLQEIEIKMGRKDEGKWGPRIIDLDILLYGDEVIDFFDLTIPHRYLKERLFVLVPLQEIDPKIVFPDDGTNIEEVLGKVRARAGNSKIIKINRGLPPELLK